MLNNVLPDNKTRSFRCRPLLLKFVGREEKLEVGRAMFAKASEAFDISPSLLPVGTLQ